MNLELWLLMLVPLIVFVVVELKWGAKAGAISAVGLAILLGIYWYFRFGTIDETLVAEVALIAVLGAISVRMNDGRWVKFQPVAMAAGFAAYCAYFQIIGDPIIIRWLPLMVKMAPQIEWMQTDPRAIYCLTGASHFFIWVFVAHGALVGFAALRFGSWWWLAARLMIYPMAMLPAFYLGPCLRG
jgi:hypothetical protein